MGSTMHGQGGTRRVTRFAAPLACLVLAIGAYSYGVAAPPSQASLGPLRLAWFPFITAGALVLLAPLLLVFADLRDRDRLLALRLEHEPSRRDADQVDQVPVEAAAATRQADEAARRAARIRDLIVVRTVTDATTSEHPEDGEVIRAFSERLVVALCNLTPAATDGAGVPLYPDRR